MAFDQFSALVYAPSTSATKDSLFSVWRKLCEQLGHRPLPVSSQSMFEVAAILRSAGYRATQAYLYEAKMRHVRQGFEWKPEHDAALADCRRAAGRGLGGPVRAEEVKLHFWQRLAQLESLDPRPECRAPQGPVGGIKLWVAASSFLLREVELACLTLDSDCIKFDHVQKVVSLHLTVQKNDPVGKGAWRSLSCSCSERPPPLCPFHTLDSLAEAQLERLRFGSIAEVPVNEFPLVGCQSEAGRFVQKRDMVEEMRRHVKILQELEPEASVLVIENITGHTPRRSGAKELARRGLPFSLIQWFARHSSNVTYQYVEEALGEAPRDSMRLQDMSTVCEILSSTLARVGRVEDALSETVRSLAQDAGPAGFGLWSIQSKADLRAEMRRSIIPVAVCNFESMKLHRVCRNTCVFADPMRWATLCGWRWMTSNGGQPYFEEDDIPVDVAKCERCFPPIGVT